MLSSFVSVEVSQSYPGEVRDGAGVPKRAQVKIGYSDANIDKRLVVDNGLVARLI